MSQEELAKQLETIENTAKQNMTREAITRYGNVRIAHPEKAIQVAIFITQAAQENKLNELVTDAQLKNILLEIQEKKQTKITFR